MARGSGARRATATAVLAGGERAEQQAIVGALTPKEDEVLRVAAVEREGEDGGLPAAHVPSRSPRSGGDRGDDLAGWSRRIGLLVERVRGPREGDPGEEWA